MKLIGSMTERKIREELIITRQEVMLRGRCSELVSALRNHFPNILSVFILEWTPEQREDIYVALIDDQFVATVEITRDGREIAFEAASVDDYRRSLKERKNQIRLAVALQIFSGSPKPS